MAGDSFPSGQGLTLGPLWALEEAITFFTSLLFFCANVSPGPQLLSSPSWETYSPLPVCS